MALELLPPEHPALRTALKPYDFSSENEEALTLATSLAETMLILGGVGLAANQVGLPWRVFAFWAHPINVIFNPRLTDVSSETVALDEACLSYPGLTLSIKRPKSIRLRYQLPSGETTTRRFEGLTARIIQHEIDHLDGKLFFDYVSRPKLDLAVQRAKRHGHAYSTGALKRKPKPKELNVQV